MNKRQPAKTHDTAANIATMLGKPLPSGEKSLLALIRKAGIKKTKAGYSIKEVLDAQKAAAGRDLRTPLSDDDPRRRKVQLENRLLEIKIAEQDGRLIDAEQVEQEAYRLGCAIRNDILAISGALAPRLVGKTDVAEIAAMLDAAHRDALRHLADTLEKEPACDTGKD